LNEDGTDKKFGSGKLKVKRALERLGVDDRIILK
jgi:hypothetical protein